MPPRTRRSLRTLTSVPVDELPAEQLACMFAATLTYAELRSVCSSCRFFAFIVAPLVRSLTVRTLSELHVAPLRRFSGVQRVVVQCFIWALDDDDDKLELCASPGRVVPFACQLPQLTDIYLGGVFSDEADFDKIWEKQGWVDSGGDLDKYYDGSDNLRLDLSYDRAHTVDANKDLLMGALCLSVCDAYLSGALSVHARWHGLLGTVHGRVCKRSQPCSICRKVFESLPAQYLLSDWLSINYREEDLIKEAARRGADLDGPGGLCDTLGSFRGTPVNLGDGTASDGFAVTWSGATFRRLRRLIQAGADPTRQALASKVQLPDRCSSCAPNDVWCMRCKEQSNSGELNNMGFNVCGAQGGRPGKRAVMRPHYDALRELGVPVQSRELKLVDITHERMVPSYNRRQDWQSYGSVDWGEDASDDDSVESSVDPEGVYYGAVGDPLMFF